MPTNQTEIRNRGLKFVYKSMQDVQGKNKKQKQKTRNESKTHSHARTRTDSPVGKVEGGGVECSIWPFTIFGLLASLKASSW